MTKKPIKRKVEPKWPKPKSRKAGAKVAKHSNPEPEKAAPAKAVEHAAPVAPPVEKPTEGCVAPVGAGTCGKPKALGQTYVCAEHIRKG